MNLVDALGSQLSGQLPAILKPYLDFATLGARLGLGDEEETSFNDAKGSMIIREGRVYSRNLYIKSDEFDADASGSFGLDQTLDYTGKLFLSKEVSEKELKKADEDLKKALVDKRGRIIIPFTVKGTFTDPEVYPDGTYFQTIGKKYAEARIRRETEKIKEKGKEELKEEIDRIKDEGVRDVLKGILGEDKKEEQKEGEKKEEKTKPVEDLLRRFF